MKKITISRNGKLLGEYDAGDIRGMVVTGEIVATDLARFEGNAEWKPLAEMLEFSGLFQPIPYTEELASTSLEDSPANESPDLSDTESPDLLIGPVPDRGEESQDEVKKQCMEEMTSEELDALPIEEQEKPEDAEYWKDLGMTSEEFDALPIEEQEDLEVKLGGKYCRQIIFRAGCFSAVIILLIFLIAIMSACNKAPVVETGNKGTQTGTRDCRHAP
ncbi:MAG: DUF4339 domain-containing protein [Verrucomicrobiales bacterium]|nr:DUF4339 domain-containing protein [Verrucomicrobiales bacterium]